MKVTVRDLLEKLSAQQVRLIAGEKGIHRGVSMVHIVENIEIAKFLLGSEIVLINGIALNEELSLLTLIEYINTKNVGAVVICTGPYIPQVDAQIIELANAHNLPLFFAPWEVYCANLIKDISRELFDAESKNTRIEVALRSALLGETHREFYEEQLSDKGWNVHSTYCVALVECANSDALNTLCDTLKLILDARSHAHGHRAAIVKIKGRLAIILSDIPPKSLHELAHALQAVFPTDAASACSMVLGKRVSGASQLHTSYACACKMLSLFDAMQEHENPNGDPFIDYETLDLYKILLSVDDIAVLKSYFDQTIAPLVQYDLYHSASLCITLKSYMKHNGSVLRASKELFAHRNTIGKQINKIEAILDVDLSEWAVRNKIMLGFLVQDFVQSDTEK